jgi:hypothetical protein
MPKHESAQRLQMMSRGTQIPEYVLQGCLAAFKWPESTELVCTQIPDRN